METRAQETDSSAGFTVYRYDAVDSTMTLAAETLVENEGAFALVAKSQNQGRGRNGNQWSSPAGNLYTTIVPTVTRPTNEWPQLSFVSALALHDALSSVLKPDQTSALTLKWPNDILFDGRKLSGLLLEAQSERCLIGIGINCEHAFDNAPYPTTSLASIGAKADLDELFQSLLACLNTRIAQWERDGFSAIRKDWLALAHGIGEPVRFKSAHDTIEGHYQGVSESGAITIQNNLGKTHAYQAGSLTFLEAGR